MGDELGSSADEPAGTSARLTFSVVIAAYEAAAFIGHAVRSALDQDPSPLQVILFTTAGDRRRER